VRRAGPGWIAQSSAVEPCQALGAGYTTADVGGNRSVQRTCLSPVAGSSGGLFVVPGCLYVRGPPTRCVCVWTGQDGRVEGQASPAVWQASPAVWTGQDGRVAGQPGRVEGQAGHVAGQPGHVGRPARPCGQASPASESCASYRELVRCNGAAS